MNCLRGALAMVAVVSLSPSAARAQTTSAPANPPVACPSGTIAGCNKGVWTLNARGVAAIAALKKPATYRICIDFAASGPVAIEVDGIRPADSASGVYSALYPSVATDEALNSGCAIVTGMQIAVLTLDFAKPLPARGEYVRLDGDGAPSQLLPFNLALTPNGMEESALLTWFSAARVARLCIGPFTRNPTPAVRHIKTEDGFIGAKKPNERGFEFTNQTCIDVESKRLALFGPRPAIADRVSGFLAY